MRRDCTLDIFYTFLGLARGSQDQREMIVLANPVRPTRSTFHHMPNTTRHILETLTREELPLRSTRFSHTTACRLFELFANLESCSGWNDFKAALAFVFTGITGTQQSSGICPPPATAAPSPAQRPSRHRYCHPPCYPPPPPLSLPA